MLMMYQLNLKCVWVASQFRKEIRSFYIHPQMWELDVVYVQCWRKHLKYNCTFGYFGPLEVIQRPILMLGYLTATTIFLVFPTHKEKSIRFCKLDISQP